MQVPAFFLCNFDVQFSGDSNSFKIGDCIVLNHTKGYFVNTVSKHGNENIIAKYVKNQEKNKDEYEELYKQQSLFD